MRQADHIHARLPVANPAPRAPGEQPAHDRSRCYEPHCQDAVSIANSFDVLPSHLARPIY